MASTCCLRTDLACPLRASTSWRKSCRSGEEEIVAADAEPRIRETLRHLDGVMRTHFKGILVSAGLPASDDDALLLQATAVGLALMHQSRLNAESLAEFPRGIDALLRLLIAQQSTANAVVQRSPKNTGASAPASLPTPKRRTSRRPQ